MAVQSRLLRQQPQLPTTQSQEHVQPSPPSYPSPSVPPSYAYSPAQAAHGNTELEHWPPTVSGMSQAPLSLPPIRAPFDGVHGHLRDSPMPPPIEPMASLHPLRQPLPATDHQPQTVFVPQMGISQQSPSLQYHLPQLDRKLLSERRHKKEIKRRTKTGCLTCRKRRIKCDETHPICRNCQKSKRDCLGYDPIFKQLSVSAQIQPAPGAVLPIATAPKVSASPPTNVSYPSPPAGDAPATSSYHLAPGHALSHELCSAIDPALACTDSTALMSFAPVAYYPSLRVYVQTADKDAMVGPLPSWLPVKGNAFPVKALFESQGVPMYAQLPSVDPIPHGLEKEIELLYARDYAYWLDRCIETTWYSTKGLNLLLRNPATMQLFASFLTHIRNPQRRSERQPLITSLETKLVWKLLRLPCQSPASVAKDNTSAKVHKLDLLQMEAALRVKVLKSLLTYETLPFDPLTELVYDPGIPSLKQEEIYFWSQLGTFVTLSDSDEESSRHVEATLASCLKVLNQIECRDVFYSMMIVRHYRGRIPELPSDTSQQPLPIVQHDWSKIMVAEEFLEREARGESMSRVIVDLTSMAIRSWDLA